MQIEEAKWIIDILNAHPKSFFPLLNIGCSSKHFRECTQPYIDEFIFKPLREKEWPVVHCDIKNEEGVDLVGNILDPDFAGRIKGMQFSAILCSNVLEHILELDIFCKALEHIVPVGGKLVITVPHVYPFHKDPIDTKFRPTPAALSTYFPNCVLIDETVLVSHSNHFVTLLSNPKNLLITMKNWLIPRWGVKEWKMRLSDIPNLFKKYQMTCVVLEKMKEM